MDYSVPITALCPLKFWELPGQASKDLQEDVLVGITTKKPEKKRTPAKMNGLGPCMATWDLAASAVGSSVNVCQVLLGLHNLF